MNELSLIKKITSLIPDASYIGDDTAYLKESEMVVTTDTLVEDVHFRLKTTTPHNLGYKAMAVNLSDIASDGAIPAYAFVSLSLPKNIDESFVEEFYKGMNELCSKFGIIIAGGDVTGAEKIFVNITLIGKTNGFKPARRSCAKAGDVVIVTGILGSSRAGLEILENEEKFCKVEKNVLEKFKNAHLRPFPYIDLGRKIVEQSKRTPAMMDTSDGLGDALFKISQSSNVAIEVMADKIPTDKDLGEIGEGKALEWALFGGEDYTLAACVEEDFGHKLAKETPEIQIIGKVIGKKANGLVKIISDKTIYEITEEMIINKAFRHFL
ncbi:MAG: thiamine-phosphate kinase [bacterium]|nr:thiamine-phosphate kinase [bacterium]